jgi:hypothetical protein
MKRKEINQRKSFVNTYDVPRGEGKSEMTRYSKSSHPQLLPNKLSTPSHKELTSHSKICSWSTCLTFLRGYWYDVSVL